jgi:hypothetical protein
MVCDNFRGVTGRSQGIIRYFDPSPAVGAGDGPDSGGTYDGGGAIVGPGGFGFTGGGVVGAGTGGTGFPPPPPEPDDPLLQEDAPKQTRPSTTTSMHMRTARRGCQTRLQRLVVTWPHIEHSFA